MSEPILAVYAVTDRGARQGARVAAALGGVLFVPERVRVDAPARRYAALGDLVAETFNRYRAHVFVGACGIAVRVIAPHLRDKHTDPAVVVTDDAGQFVISVLSGHLGGANDLARDVAGLLGAIPVVTTATDAAGAPAMELLARQSGLVLDDPAATRRLNAVLAAGDRVAIFDPLGAFVVTEPAMARFFDWVGTPAPPEPAEPLVVVDWRLGPDAPNRFYLRPPVLAVGVGCRRGATAEAILQHIDMVCDLAHASNKSIGLLASIVAKADEPGLLQAAATRGWTTRFFTAEALGTVPVPHPSAMVAKHMGVDSVCEAAAILATKGGRLLVPKTRSATVTAALALAH